MISATVPYDCTDLSSFHSSLDKEHQKTHRSQSLLLMMLLWFFRIRCDILCLLCHKVSLKRPYLTYYFLIINTFKQSEFRARTTHNVYIVPALSCGFFFRYELLLLRDLLRSCYSISLWIIIPILGNTFKRNMNRNFAYGYTPRGSPVVCPMSLKPSLSTVGVLFYHNFSRYLLTYLALSYLVIVSTNV
jgi:hypothetical protein